MLKGGDSVPIVPVQGGGSLNGVPSPSYNPNESLLDGGNNVPIVAVRGGGEEEKKNLSSAAARVAPPPMPSAPSGTRDFLPARTVIPRVEPRSVPRREIPEQLRPFLRYSNGTEDARMIPSFSKVGTDEEPPISSSTSKKEGSSIGEENEENEYDNDFEENENNEKDKKNKKDENEENEYENDFEENENNNSVKAEGNDENRKENDFEEDEKNEENEKEEGGEEKKPSTPCDVPKDEELAEMKKLDKEFSSSVIDEGVIKHTEIFSKGLGFKLRRPARRLDPKSYDDPIYKDWISQKFTEQEADFLNSLGLSPRLLFQTFYCLDRDWVKELAEFLYFLSVESCWPARATLMLDKCRSIREFLSLACAQMRVEELRKYQSDTKSKGWKLAPIGFDTFPNDDEEDEGEEKDKKGKEEGEGKGEEDKKGKEEGEGKGEEKDKKGKEEGDEEKTNEESDKEAEEIFNKILQQMEEVRKGNLGRDILLKEIASELPEEYQTQEFMNKLLEKGILEKKDPWYTKLSKKFFKKNPKP